ncbi:MAG TPA: DUF3037 domain-containing protein [Bryobacteraceae bacterium]
MKSPAAGRMLRKYGAEIPTAPWHLRNQSSGIILATQRPCYNILRFALPNGEVFPIGVLIYDPAADRLHVRIRPGWKSLPEEQGEILNSLADDLKRKVDQLGALQVIQWLEDRLSNALQISERHELASADPESELDKLYASVCRS